MVGTDLRQKREEQGDGLGKEGFGRDKLLTDARSCKKNSKDVARVSIPSFANLLNQGGEVKGRNEGREIGDHPSWDCWRAEFDIEGRRRQDAKNQSLQK